MHSARCSAQPPPLDRLSTGPSPSPDPSRGTPVPECLVDPPAAEHTADRHGPPATGPASSLLTKTSTTLRTGKGIAESEGSPCSPRTRSAFGSPRRPRCRGAGAPPRHRAPGAARCGQPHDRPGVAELGQDPADRAGVSVYVPPSCGWKGPAPLNGRCDPEIPVAGRRTPAGAGVRRPVRLNGGHEGEEVGRRVSARWFSSRRGPFRLPAIPAPTTVLPFAARAGLPTAPARRRRARPHLPPAAAPRARPAPAPPPRHPASAARSSSVSTSTRPRARSG